MYSIVLFIVETSFNGVQVGAEPNVGGAQLGGDLVAVDPPGEGDQRVQTIPVTACRSSGVAEAHQVARTSRRSGATPAIACSSWSTPSCGP